MASAIKQTQTTSTSTSTNSCSEPEDDSSDSSDDDEVVDRASRDAVQGCPALPMGAVRSSDIISIPTFEADGAVNMV